jgi:hypothetical protein
MTTLPSFSPTETRTEDAPTVELPVANINLCAQVRDTCRRWIETPKAKAHVEVLELHLPDPPATITEDHVTVSKYGTNPNHISPLALIAQIQQQANVVWDEEDWHYQLPPVAVVASATATQEPPSTTSRHQPNRNRTELTRRRQTRIANYILVLDAINFCFWPQLGYEYVDLAQTLTSMASADHRPLDHTREHVDAVLPDHDRNFLLSAESLQTYTPDQLTKLMALHHKQGKVPPNVAERCQLLNQVGAVLATHFEGSAWNVIQAANHSAVRLVGLLVTYFAGFGDFGGTAGSHHHQDPNNPPSDEMRPIAFLKRAQICVGDWDAALQLNLPDLDQLTTFADYRVPQVLRNAGWIRYRPSLAVMVDQGVEIARDSPEEWSIRAATVVAVEHIVKVLRRQQLQQSSTHQPTSSSWTAVRVDWYLWQLGERMQAQGELLPPHKVRTIYY